MGVDGTSRLAAAASTSNDVACHESLQQQQQSGSASGLSAGETPLYMKQSPTVGLVTQPGLAEQMCQLEALQAPGQDLLKQLLERGVSVKLLKEQLPDSMRYGQIRLSLAHIGRLGLLPQLLAEAISP